MKTAIRKPHKAGKYKTTKINKLLNLLYFREGYFEDGSEPLRGLFWSICKRDESGKYLINTNLVEDCFEDDIPNDGLYPLVIKSPELFVGSNTEKSTTSKKTLLSYKNFK